MKPFNLEEALAGKPVVTRSGRPVKIAGYNKDAGHLFQVVGWVGPDVWGWRSNGKFLKEDYTDDLDLFMAPTERKEWVVRLRLKTGEIAYTTRAFASLKDAKDYALMNEVLNPTIHEITITE